MLKQRNLWLLMMLLFVFASLNSGCGGSSSSSGGGTTEQGNGGTGQQETVNQSQDVTPNNPTSQDNTPTPQNNTPTSQDNTATPVSFSVLAGTWKASSGSGTVTSGDTTAQLRLSTTHSNTISFTDVTVSGDTARAFLNQSDMYWDIYLNNAVLDDWSEDFGMGGQFQNTSVNTWLMEYTMSSGTPTRTTVTFTSATAVQVERYEVNSRGIIFRANYTLTKQ